MPTRNTLGKRETSKWIPLINHRALGKCAILVKEKNNEKYWLLWWWISKWEKTNEALKREIREEIWKGCSIEKLKYLVTIETNSQVHNIFALKISWKFDPNPREIEWFAFYPLEDNYSKEREAIREKTEYYAKEALMNFRNNHQWKSYETSNPQIEWEYFDTFHKELNQLKQEIQKKANY